MRATIASWRGAGVRKAVTALTLVSIVGPLLLGIGVLALLLHRSLTSSLVEEATTRAYDVARLLADEGPDRVAIDARFFAAEGAVIQVVKPDGSVGYYSAPHADQALTTARPAPGVTEVSGASALPTLTGPTPPVIAARGVDWRDGRYTVVVLIRQAATRAAVLTIVKLLLAVLPVWLVFAGVLTWRMVGRALEPVLEVTRTVDEIGGHPRGQRVPVPDVDDEIGRLASTMNDMLERIDLAQSQQRRFVADASHELRSPITSLRMAVELGASNTDPAELRELWALVDTESARMKDLVEDLLTLSKSDDPSRVAPQLAEVDLDDIVAAEAARLVTTSGRQVRRSIEPARVLGDLGQLTRVVRNLADNAARAAASTVSLTLTVDPGTARATGATPQSAPNPAVNPAGDPAGNPAHGTASVYVDDDGPGVLAPDRERVFERFVRLDDDRSRGSGGSGLGLAIVRELVRAHGGQVWVADSPLGGARFAVRLPLLAGVLPMGEPDGPAYPA